MRLVDSFLTRNFLPTGLGGSLGFGGSGGGEVWGFVVEGFVEDGLLLLTAFFVVCILMLFNLGVFLFDCRGDLRGVLTFFEDLQFVYQRRRKGDWTKTKKKKATKKMEEEEDVRDESEREKERGDDVEK